MSTITEQPNAKLSKGEKTKQHILCSAIAILASKGVKGATHRAIADHAEIQLSLTTYYFKDIQDLLRSAFRLNSSKLLLQFQHQFVEINKLLTSFSNSELKKVSVRQQLRQQLITLLEQLIVSFAKNFPSYIIVEQQMYTEAHHCVKTREIMQNHHQNYTQLLSRFSQRFSKNEYSIDAELMLFTIQYLYNQYLQQGDYSSNKITAMLQQVSPILCKVKA